MSMGPFVESSRAGNHG